MKSIRSGIFILLLTVSILHGQSPLEVIKSSNQGVLDILADHPQVTDEMEEEIVRIMNAVTDFAKISQRAIQKYCPQLNTAECMEFDAVFQELLRVSSLSKVGRYRAERFDYVGEEIKGNEAVVRTIAYYENESYELDYYLELTDKSWKIVNYVADGVDTIKNYKKQFLRILKKETIAQLVQRLKIKIEEYENAEME